MTEAGNSSLPGDFEAAAQPVDSVPARRAVYLLLDSDLVDWLRDQYGDWPGHINDLIRFEKDTSQPLAPPPRPEDLEPSAR